MILRTGRPVGQPDDPDALASKDLVERRGEFAIPISEQKADAHWLDTEGDDLASFAVVVPSWTLIVTFVVGLVVGAVAGRLMAVRGSSGAPDKMLEPLQPETKPVGLASGTSGVSHASDKRDAPASGVDDLVSELERRYQGRRADGEADKPAQGRDL